MEFPQQACRTEILYIHDDDTIHTHEKLLKMNSYKGAVPAV